VVTDHSPSTAELKFAHHGDFARAWGGIAGLEVGFRAVWTEARARGLGLETVVDWMATRTSALVGLSDRGRIAPGLRADLVAFDPEEPFAVDVARLAHKNPVSAYDRRSLTGAIRRVWLAGTEITETTGQGDLLSSTKGPA
jgi:allantoinase